MKIGVENQSKHPTSRTKVRKPEKSLVCCFFFKLKRRHRRPRKVEVNDHDETMYFCWERVGKGKTCLLRSISLFTGSNRLQAVLHMLNRTMENH